MGPWPVVVRKAPDTLPVQPLNTSGASPAGLRNMILVTGGAGFIGSNFVLDWLAPSDEPVVNLDALTYAGNTREPGLARRRPRAMCSCTATSATGRCSIACSPSTGRARSSTSRPRATSTAASTARPRSSGPTSRAPSRCSRRRARTGRRCRRRARRRSASSTSRPTRSTARSAADDAGVHASRTRYEPNSPYSASKAASDHLVRAWHHTYGLPVLTTNCSEQLRALPLSREADPADDRQRARRQAAAGLRRRPAGARLALREGPLRGDPRGAGARHAPARPTTSAAGTRSRTSRSCTTVCALLDEMRPDPDGSRTRASSPT